MSASRSIEITPIHQHILEKNQALQHALLFVVLVLLTFGVAYQTVQIDHQMAIAARV